MLRFEIFPKCRFVDLIVDEEDTSSRRATSFPRMPNGNMMMNSDSTQQQSVSPIFTTENSGDRKRRVRRPSNCPPMPVSAYWASVDGKGWYRAKMYELYEDAACVEYVDYPGQKHEIPRSWVRVVEEELSTVRWDDDIKTEVKSTRISDMFRDAAMFRSRQDIKVDDTEMEKDAATFRLHQDIKVDDTEMEKDAATFRLRQDIKVDDTEMEKDAATFRSRQDIKVDDTEMEKDAATFRLRQDIKVDDKEMEKDAATFRLRQDIKVDDKEMEKDAVTFRSRQDIKVDDTEMNKDAAKFKSHQDTDDTMKMTKDAAMFKSHQDTDDTEMTKNAATFSSHQDIDDNDVKQKINLKEKTNKSDNESKKKKSKSKKKNKKKANPVECLVKAAKYGRFRSVAHWLEQGADVNGRELRHGYTALHWAAWKGYTKIMDLLLKNGADPRITNHRGETVLESAKLAEQTETYELLAAYASKLE